MGLFVLAVVLAVILVLLNLGDCYTTYVDLTTKTTTSEKTALARYFFQKIGLIPTMIIKMIFMIAVALWAVAIVQTNPVISIAVLLTLDYVFVRVVYKNYKIMIKPADK